MKDLKYFFQKLTVRLFLTRMSGLNSAFKFYKVW